MLSSTEMNGDNPANREIPERIVGLDGLRAVSILLVLIGHGWSTIPTSDEYAILYPYFGNSGLGVQTFFVLSGFLITFLLRKEWEKTGSIGIKAFYLRRILRIFPALYTYLLVLTLIRVLGWVDTTYGDLAIAGTFATNYKHLLPIPSNEDYWFVAQFWTLSLEEQFYFFWPATILAVGITRAPNVALTIVLVSPFVRGVTYVLWPEVRPQISIMLHTAADPIMIGCLAALWHGGVSFKAILSRFSSGYWLLSAILFLLVGSPWLVTQFHGVYGLTIGLSLNGVAIAYIMLWVMHHPRSLPTRLLSTALFRHIGILSYSLYLWQQMFLTTKNQTWTGVFPINFVMCFVLAEVSFWAVERPFLRLRDHFRGKQTAPVKAVEVDLACVAGPAGAIAAVDRSDNSTGIL